MIRRILHIFVLALILSLIALPGGVSRVQAAAGSPPAPKPLAAGSSAGDIPTATPNKHQVVVMQENHSFDNYFGTYPGAEGLDMNTQMPVDPNNPAAGWIGPWHLTGSYTITDLSHSTATFYQQYNQGDMNGFVYALDQRKQDGRVAMGYYNGQDIPYYWNLADNYVLFDRWYSSAKDGSFANHMFWALGANPQPDKGQPLAPKLVNVPTIFDRLQQKGISWKFYVQNYDPNITYRDAADYGARASQVIWVPLLNFDRFIDDPSLNGHIVDLSQYYADLSNGTLPSVAYIVPSGASEHPPSSLDSGQRFVRTLIQELMRSQRWNDSAFLLLYDDWGGWYDHVRPPMVDQYGYGLRVPGILVSPYARKGYIDSTTLDFTSVLKFIEENWGVAPLADRDSKATSFVSAFDFDQIPRKPEFISFNRLDPALVAATTKKSPAAVIYGAYGIALFLSVFLISFAFIRSRRRPARLVQREANL